MLCESVVSLLCPVFCADAVTRSTQLLAFHEIRSLVDQEEEEADADAPRWAATATNATGASGAQKPALPPVVARTAVASSGGGGGGRADTECASRPMPPPYAYQEDPVEPPFAKPLPPRALPEPLPPHGPQEPLPSHASAYLYRSSAGSLAPESQLPIEGVDYPTNPKVAAAQFADLTADVQVTQNAEQHQISCCLKHISKWFRSRCWLHGLFRLISGYLVRGMYMQASRGFFPSSSSLHLQLRPACGACCDTRQHAVNVLCMLQTRLSIAIPTQVPSLEEDSPAELWRVARPGGSGGGGGGGPVAESGGGGGSGGLEAVPSTKLLTANPGGGLGMAGSSLKLPSQAWLPMVPSGYGLATGAPSLVSGFAELRLNITTSRFSHSEGRRMSCVNEPFASFGLFIRKSCCHNGAYVMGEAFVRLPHSVNRLYIYTVCLICLQTLEQHVERHFPSDATALKILVNYLQVLGLGCNSCYGSIKLTLIAGVHGDSSRQLDGPELRLVMTGRKGFRESSSACCVVETLPRAVLAIPGVHCDHARFSTAPLADYCHHARAVYPAA